MLFVQCLKYLFWFGPPGITTTFSAMSNLQGDFHHWAVDPSSFSGCRRRWLWILANFEVTWRYRGKMDSILCQKFLAAKDLPVFQGSKNRWQGRDLWASLTCFSYLDLRNLHTCPVMHAESFFMLLLPQNKIYVCESWVLNSVEIVLSRIRSKRAFVLETFESKYCAK